MPLRVILIPLALTALLPSSRSHRHRESCDDVDDDIDWLPTDIVISNSSCTSPPDCSAESEVLNAHQAHQGHPQPHLREPRKKTRLTTQIASGTHEHSRKNQNTLMSNDVQNTQLRPRAPQSTPATTPLNLLVTTFKPGRRARPGTARSAPAAGRKRPRRTRSRFSTCCCLSQHCARLRVGITLSLSLSLLVAGCPTASRKKPRTIPARTVSIGSPSCSGQPAAPSPTQTNRSCRRRISYLHRSRSSRRDREVSVHYSPKA